MIKALRAKFICVNMAIVLVMMCAILATVLVFTHNNLERNAENFMQEIAADPMRVIRPGEVAPGVQLPYFSVEISHNGKIAVTNGGYYNLDDADMIEAITASSISSKQNCGVLSEYNLRYYRIATPIAERIVFVDISNEVSTMDHLFRYCLVIGGASLVVFFFISLGLSYWAIRPVDMAWKQQKRFISDASHELKTPLALISLNVEMMEASPLCQEDPLNSKLHNIMLGTERMRSLVSSLLELAKTDSELPHAQMTQLDLSNVVTMGVLTAEALFIEKNQRLTVAITPDIRIYGSGQHMNQLLSILLDNAHKYGTENGTVSIKLWKSSVHSCILSVRNTGDPIPREKLRQIFERFYRLDEARVSNGSYGLGLAIAEGIVREHHGRIWAESTEHENVFYVQLPIGPASEAQNMVGKIWHLF